MRKQRRWRRALLMLVVGVLMIAAAGAVGWALATVLTPAADPLASTRHTFIEVSTGEVGSSVTANTTAVWTPTPAGSNAAAGVVTTVNVNPGDEVSQGTVLYTVNLRPVSIAAGDVPSFRAIGPGTQGPDVAQLQTMLEALDLYRGDIDGIARTQTVNSIRAWQRSTGVEASGTVEASDVIYVPRLPARISLDTQTLKRGATLSGGEQIVLALPDSPSFRLSVTEAQAALMPSGTRVAVSGPTGEQWDGFVAEQIQDPQSQTINVRLTGRDGATICGSECSVIPVVGEVSLRSQVITAEPVTGLVVPTSSLITQADGSTAVVDAEGERHPVSVIGSAKGMAVVEGVPEGMRLQVPAKADQSG